MPATLTTFGPMLKEFYQGPVAEQINNRVWIREYFQKKSKGWSGSRMVIPVHVGRNTGVGFTAEGNNLPTAGDQQYNTLVVNSRNSYGRFQVTGEAMDTATKGGAGAFAGVMNEEMDRLVRDLANNENYSAVFGGNVKGLLNQRQANGQDTSGQQTAAGNNISTGVVWQYQGDFSYFDGTRTGVAVNNGNIATWVRVELIDLDTYALIPVTIGATGAPAGAAAANPNIFVRDFSADRTNPTVTLSIGVDTAGACTFTTATVGAQSGIGLRLHTTQAVDGAGPPAVAMAQNPAVWGDGVAGSAATLLGAQNLTANQPIGLFGNLCEPTHFGVDRTTATGTADILQSTIVTHDVANGDRTNPGADLSLERLQYMMDIMQQDAGVDANVMVMNALMRHRYTVQLTGIMGTSNNVFLNGDNGKLMDNQQSLAYGGVKFQYDRTFPVATIALLHSDDWLLAELATGQFADEDGNVLFRVQNQDAYEGFWKHRYNVCCKRPNAQVILTGITPT